jgi:hypothetical protein
MTGHNRQDSTDTQESRQDGQQGTVQGLKVRRTFEQDAGQAIMPV